MWAVINATKQVYGDDMAAFLCFMAVRLLEMHRVLRDDGSLYLHIDHTAHAYVKALLDAIFGRRNFRNEIVWAYEDVGGRATSYFKRKHDTILSYQKTDAALFNIQRKRLSDSTIRIYGKYFDENGQITYRSLQESNPGVFRKLKGIPDDLDRVWLDENAGSPLNDWWSDISAIKRGFGEATGYPTQKPLALYERIIKASSNPDDVVLDPFCGCATTPIAAERLGRQWVGVDIWDGAIDVVRQRMEDNRQLLAEPNPQIHYRTEPPERTDEGETAVLSLRTPTGRGRRYPPPRQQHGKLLLDVGAFCQGCGRDYSFDPRVLEVDHIRPKSDGGSDAYDNLTLLCPPCNRAKLDRMTLTGLQEQNRREGYLLRENEDNLRIGRAQRARRRRRRR